MSTFRQLSFSGGEISPSLYARVDQVKYSTGLRTARNFFVQRHGGAANRPGTEFICEVKDSTKSVRLIPFVFNADQTYQLEFGDYYMRVIHDGVQVTDSTKNITAATKANPIVLTSNSHGFSNGEEVYISGVSGMTQLNNRNFKVSSVATNTFSLTYMDGTVVNSTAFSTYVSGGTASRVYTIVSQYAEADLPTLNFIQSADVITIAHPNYPPTELARTGHTSWAFSAVVFAPSIAAPTALTGGTAGSNSYVVTATAADTFEESLSSVSHTTNSTSVTLTWAASTGAIEYSLYRSVNGVYGFIGTAIGLSFTDSGITPDTTVTPPTSRTPFAPETATNISAITQASPAVVTSNSHGLLNGDVVYITGVVGMTQVNGKGFYVASATTNTFALHDFNGDNIDSTGYTAYSSGGTAALADNYPSTVSYYQQRLLFANTNAEPEKVWTSRTAQFSNFTTSQPFQDDDAVTFTLAGRQINEVRHLIDLGKLLMLTSGGEWAAQGDVAGILKPTDINSKQYSYNGSNELSPIIVSENALYIQARGTIIRDLGFDYQIDGYRGNDLTIFATHLFDNHSIVDWTYQQVPNSIVWAARDDGVLLGLTYVREHQVFGWHHHDFSGVVENVSAIPDGGEDFLYLVVNRTIDGVMKRYIERMHSRLIDDVIDNVFMDSALSYDGRNTGTQTMTLSGGTTWVYTETLTLTSSTSYFTAAEVGNQIHLTGSDGTIIRFTITGYTSATVVTGKPNKTVPAAMRSAAITDWARAVDQVTGLWHLEGETVSVFADRFVVASPNNDSYVTVTVADGTITLDKPYAVIHVGLPITADIETLDIDTVQGESIADKRKIVSRVTAFVESSRGIWAGAEPPSDDDDDPLENLSELKIRNQESYDEPVALSTGSIEINIKPEWNSNGRVFIRQVDPIPLSVLAVLPAGLFPFKGGV